MINTLDSMLMQKAQTLVHNQGFQVGVKQNEQDFSRKRKLSFEQLIAFILNRPTLSLYAEVERVFHQLQNIDVTKDAVIKARKKIRYTALEEFFNLSADVCLYFDPTDSFSAQFLLKNQYRVFAIDGTDIRLEGANELKDYFGYSRSQPKRAHARASILCEVSTGVVADAKLVPHATGERKLAMTHLEQFKQYQSDKDIILFDRGYPSKELLARLSDQGLFYVMRVSKSFSPQIDSSTVPEENLLVSYEGRDYMQRIIRFNLPNNEHETEVLLTNLSPDDFLHADFMELYHMRWGVETKFNSLKNKLQMETFSGRNVNTVLQDFYATMFVTNLIAAIRCNAQKLLDEREEGQTYKAKHKVSENALISQLKDMLIMAIAAEDPDVGAALIGEMREKASRCYYNERPSRAAPPRDSKETHHKKSSPVKRPF